MDLSKVKAKLANLENNSRKSNSIWKPELGSQVIRFVPARYNPDYPFLEMYFYYDLEKRPIVSPISFGDSDPIVELAEQLKSTGDKEDWILGKQLEPKLRTYAPILERGKEKEGVKYYGFGKTVFQELLKLINDPDYGDITDPKKGTDMTIQYEKPDGESYPKTTIRPKRNISVMTEDAEVVEMIKNMPLPEDIWTPPTYDVLKDKLDEYVGITKEQGEEKKAAAASRKREESSNAGSPAPKNTTPSAEQGDDNSTGGIKPTNNPDKLLDDIFAD